MTSPNKVHELKRKQAIDDAGKLSPGELLATPEAILKAALDCFEVGAPDEAKLLLDRFKNNPEVSGSAWYARFRAWLDAADAKQRLDTPSPFDADDTETIRNLAARLRNASRFDLSRRLLARLVGESEDLLSTPKADAEKSELLPRLKLSPNYERNIQKLSLSTYKDSDLHPARALAEAERLLALIGLGKPVCDDPETLGQGGAIYKRRWELTGRLEYLQQSLAYYRQGWEALDVAGQRRDREAYCGGNAAFVMDLLASRMRGLDEASVNLWREQAKTLRESIVALLQPRLESALLQPNADDRWVMTSLADALFALGRYDEAAGCYKAAGQVMKGDWERKTTFLQAVAVAQLQGIPLPEAAEGSGPFNHPAWAALIPLLGVRTAAALAGARPKTGLALSGGGFRAAFYHLGVLARLAEVDALRHVEIISTVSGGSIVGTLYFLKLKQLLERMPDAQITADDYRDLVGALIDEFRAGVRNNLRMRAFASITALCKMLYRLDYNRTLRMGELYDEYFYRRILRKERSTLRDLIVVPEGASRDFSPRQDNWLRRAKVPILLINATNLNSGHSWQFAGSFMGEPPGLLEAEIDANERYARLHFDDPAQAKWKEFALGSAVASSSAVPGLFNPVPLVGTHAQRDIQLADGGVYDNQGVDTLLQESCSLILCSDASGQLDDDLSPATISFKVLGRANNITMERDRIIEYQDLRSRLEHGALSGLLFVHLRQGLDIGRVQPAGEPAGRATADARPEMTDYGVAKDMQRLLSSIRTDLDSFTDIEADALMLSGYLATGRQIEQQQASTPTGTRWGGFDPLAGSCGDWPFRWMAHTLCSLPEEQDETTKKRVDEVKSQLAASSQLFAKLLHMRIGLAAKALIATPIIAAAGVVAAAIVWGLAIVGAWMTGHFCYLELVAWLIGGGLLLVSTIGFARKSKLRRLVQRLGELAFAVLVWPVAVAGLFPFNRLFLKRGSRERLQGIK
jgi:predicted acylesterase/phospholipase RssA